MLPTQIYDLEIDVQGVFTMTGNSPIPIVVGHIFITSTGMIVRITEVEIDFDTRKIMCKAMSNLITFTEIENGSAYN